MIYEVKLNPKTIALAAAGAALLGMPLDAALLRPIVVAAGSPPEEKPTGPHAFTVRRIADKTTNPTT